MTTSQRPTVVGVFDDYREAEHAVEDLHDSGFREDQVGIASRGESRDAARGGQSSDAAGRGSADEPAAEGAARGAVTGGVIGGILGALAAGLIPGIGPVIAGGLLAGVLGGAAVGAAAGGLFGALTAMGVPEEEARYYDDEFQGGRTIVTVKGEGRGDEARSILRDHGAYDIENRDAPRSGAMHERGQAVTMRGGQGGGTSPSMGGSSTGSMGAQQSMATWDDARPMYRQRWEQQHGASGGRWEDAEPGYRYGYEMARDARFRERNWSEAEPEIAVIYVEWIDAEGYRSDNSGWDRVRENARESFEDSRTGARNR